jgi:hypothetical protein
VKGLPCVQASGTIPSVTNETGTCGGCRPCRWKRNRIELQDKYDNSRPRASTINRIARARLDWLPIPIANAKAWVSGLGDTETGWFWNLIFSSLAAELQGYLPNSSNLWTIAGAKRSDFWESHKSRVLARFEFREMDGTSMLCFPPLVEIVDQQSRKLRKPRSALSLSSLKSNYENQKREREENRAQKKEAHHDNRATPKPTGLDRLIPD